MERLLRRLPPKVGDCVRVRGLPLGLPLGLPEARLERRLPPLGLAARLEKSGSGSGFWRVDSARLLARLTRGLTTAPLAEDEEEDVRGDPRRCFGEVVAGEAEDGEDRPDGLPERFFLPLLVRFVRFGEADRPPVGDADLPRAPPPAPAPAPAPAPGPSQQRWAWGRGGAPRATPPRASNGVATSSSLTAHVTRGSTYVP